MNKITVLFPGGFKPLTGAHLALARRYAESPNVERVIMLIGPKDRDGITREKTMQMFELMNNSTKIQMQPTAYNSPITAAYEYLFALPQDATGNYAMAASTKGDDYVRAKAFIPNVDKYIAIGDKTGRTMPSGIDATELNVDVDPITYNDGITPISATTVRTALQNNDYATFAASYPGYKEAVIKNIWQILTGLQETRLFSKEWWLQQLQEDVDDVIEAIMNTSERGAHNKKITKLRSYLDNNRDDSFVYDFDKFPKTVFGGVLTEFVICEICKTSMKQITPNHLKHKHQLTIAEYKKQFPGANMISESLRVSLSENNPMNDPRSIDKIKQTKQEKYGNPSFNNIKKQQQTLMETYGVSNPAALPHNIERAKKQLEDIRARAYESGRYLDPADKPAYIRYRDNVRKLSEQTIKRYKTQIKNIENRSRKFHLDHKYSIFEGFNNNIDANILAHICNLEILPSTINETKNIKSSITLIELIHSIKKHDRRELLVCGGAAGHMAHPYDDHGLTFGDMKEIVARALEGRLDIEEAVTEKTDGQNIQVTWKNGHPGFARNKGTVINPMTPEQIVADFERKYQESIQKNGAEASEGYKRVVEAYRACAEDLTSALTKLNPQQLQQIFKDGRVFANMEIIFPATKNVISYDKAHLQFHNLVEYDEAGNVIQTDLTGGNMLQGVIRDANADMQKTFSFIPSQQIKIGRVADFEDQQAAFFNEIDQLRTRYNLKDTDQVTEYHRAWWADVIRSKAQQSGYDITDDILNALIYRWGFFDKSTNISILKKQIDNLEFVTWMTEFDKKEFKQYYKQNMEPFESIFLRLGAVILRNAENFLAANPSKAVQEIKQEIAQLIKELQTSTNTDSIKKLEHELRRIEKLGGFDAIVPSEGVVFVYKGNTYKLTGAFAPVNQILGVLKYAR